MSQYRVACFALLACVTGLPHVNAADDKTSIEVSASTTNILAPVRPDGTIDYVRAVNKRASEGVTLENNAIVPLLQVFGPEHRDFSEKWLSAVYRELGMEPMAKGQDRFRSIFDLIKEEHPDWDTQQVQQEFNKVLDHSHSQAMSRPWTRDEHPWMAKWVDANKEELELIHQAVRRPKHYMPYIGSLGEDENEEAMPELIAVLLPVVQSEREIARLLTASAMLHLGEGRDSKAMADLEASHRLAHLLGSGSNTLIESLVAIAIDAITTNSDNALIAYGDFTAEEWLAYRDRLQTLPKFRSLAGIMNEGERWMGLDVVAALERGTFKTYQGVAGMAGSGSDSPMGRLLYRIATSFAIDWNIVLRRLNNRYDQLVIAGQSESRIEREQRFDAIDEELKKLRTELQGAGLLKRLTLTLSPRTTASNTMADILASLLLPATRQVYVADERYRTKRNVLHVALTLAAHKAKTGAYPDTLQALTPASLKTLPTDIYTDAALHYESTGKGFKLWSVGENGIDDGGKTYGDIGPDGERYDDTIIQVPLRKDEND